MRGAAKSSPPIVWKPVTFNQVASLQRQECRRSIEPLVTASVRSTNFRSQTLPDQGLEFSRLLTAQTLGMQCFADAKTASGF